MVTTVVELDKVREALKAAEAEAAQLKVAADKKKAEVIESGINPFGTSTTERQAFEAVDEAYKPYDAKRQEAEELRAQLDRLTQIEGLSSGAGGGSRRPFGGESRERGHRRETVGTRFIESEQYKALGLTPEMGEAAFAAVMQAGMRTPVSVVDRDELGALLAQWNNGPLATTVTGGGATSAGPFVQNDLVPGFISYRRKRPLVSGLVSIGQTDSDTVEYVTQSAPTDAAAETAEDSAAPESTYAYATNTANVREITHFVPVTLRAMADAGQIRTIIENELTLGTLDRLDTQLVSGNGSGQNLTGLYNASSIGTVSAAGKGKAEAIHNAMTAIRIAAGVLSEPDNIGLHPSDYEDLILEQDANGAYIFGPPGSAESRTCWGVPLVSSTVFTSGTPLVGDYFGSARLWIREALQVTTGLNSDDFTKRRVSMLAALRVAFAVVRPGGICTITSF